MTVVTTLLAGTLFLAGCLVATLSPANEATEIFECSELARGADLHEEEYQLAAFGYEQSLKEVPEAVKLTKEAAGDQASFVAERSPEFWAGMWYGMSVIAVRDWLQEQHPVQAREGASTTERIATVLRQREVWKPIAGKEFRQRGCEIFLLRHKQ